MSNSNMKGLKVYIAAPFFNEEQLDVVRKIELLLEREGVDFFSPRSEGILKDLNVEQRKLEMGRLFRSNVDHMDWCTHCVAVVDDYDTGTVWEMGYLYATHKKLITFSACYHGINVMLNESIVAHCITYESIIDGLKGIFEDTKTGDVT